MNDTIVLQAPETIRVKSAEVHSLMDNHRMSLGDAAEIVCIDPQDVVPNDHCRPLPYLPTPTEIEEITAKIQSGELYFSVRSTGQWEKKRAGEERASEAVEGLPFGDFDTAGELPEDVCITPSWFRGE